MGALPVAIGDVVAGKYRVERVLGEGGMGIVAAARHVQLDERIALKFLHEEAAEDADLVARFQREARLSARIRSDHIARVTDVGVLDSGAPFMVMEYLEGEDLATLVERGPALSITRAIDLVLQACEAIADAHALGIVHRDLKPSNLFVTRKSDGAPFVKVLDFGISKIAKKEPAELTLTRTNALLGSPSYMSPEQLLDSRKVDARSDIWAMGVVLYEILTCRPPFEGETLPEVSARIAASPHVPIQNVRPDVPDALAAVLDRTLAKRPEDRYATVADLARALLPFAPAESGPSVRRIEASVGKSDPRVALDAESSARMHAIAHGATVSVDAKSGLAGSGGGGRRSRLAIAGALGVVVLGLATGVAWSLSRRAGANERPIHEPTASAAPLPEPTPSASLATTAIEIPPQPVTSTSSVPHAVLKPAPAVAPHAAPRPSVAATTPTPTTAPTPPPPFDSRK